MAITAPSVTIQLQRIAFTKATVHPFTKPSSAYPRVLVSATLAIIFPTTGSGTAPIFVADIQKRSP